MTDSFSKQVEQWISLFVAKQNEDDSTEDDSTSDSTEENPVKKGGAGSGRFPKGSGKSEKAWNNAITLTDPELSHEDKFPDHNGVSGDHLELALTHAQIADDLATASRNAEAWAGNTSTSYANRKIVANALAEAAQAHEDAQDAHDTAQEAHFGAATEHMLASDTYGEDQELHQDADDYSRDALQATYNAHIASVRADALTTLASAIQLSASQPVSDYSASVEAHAQVADELRDTANSLDKLGGYPDVVSALNNAADAQQSASLLMEIAIENPLNEVVGAAEDQSDEATNQTIDAQRIMTQAFRNFPIGKSALRKGGPGSGRYPAGSHIIQDWTGRTLFGGKVFPSFEEAWEYIYANDPMPEEGSPNYDSHYYDDYYAVPVEEATQKSALRKGGESSGRYPKGSGKDTSTVAPATPAELEKHAARMEQEFHHAEANNASNEVLADRANKVRIAYETLVRVASKSNDYYSLRLPTYRKQADAWGERAYRLYSIMHRPASAYGEKANDFQKSVNPKMIEELLSEADALEERAVELAEMGLLDAAADYCREAADCFDVIVEAFKPEGNGEVIGEASAFAENLRASADALLRLRDEVTRPSVMFNTVTKGGPGSGEREGHPFRGNRFTVGHAELQAQYHDIRSGTESFHHGEHFDAADSHIKAGEEAMNRGEYSVARSHFNEAAYHAAQAAHQVKHDTGDPDYPLKNQKIYDKANALYYKAHKAGDAAQQASKAKNDVARFDRRGGLLHRITSRISPTGHHLRATAKATSEMAHSHKEGLVAHNKEVARTRRAEGDPTVRARTPRVRTRYRRQA